MNEIGSVSYTLEAESILLITEMNLKFSQKQDLSYNEERDCLDRLVKGLSNMAPNISFLSPKDYLSYCLKNKSSDYFQLSENLNGKCPASFMDSDQIKKIICKKIEEEEEAEHFRHKSIVETFLMNKPKMVEMVKKLGFGLREHNELTEDFHLKTPLE